MVKTARRSAISTAAPGGEGSDAAPDAEASPGGSKAGRAGCLAIGLLSVLGVLVSLLVLS